MLKTSFRTNTKTWALPLSVAWRHDPAVTTIQINVLCFAWQLIYVNVPKVDETLESIPEAPNVKATKAYADDRQKAKRNRRRKPSKAMANLYQLKGS